MKPNLEAQRILVVDDDALFTSFLSKYLRHFGHDVEVVNEGAKIVETLKKTSCDAVVLDLNLGKTDGIDLLPEIRADFPDLPVVIYTGLGYDEGRLQSALKNGANGYVSKLLPPEELYAALARALTVIK